MTTVAANAAPVAVALRDNPLRKQLLVSALLGKHVPTAPSVLRRAAVELAVLVGAAARAAGVDPADAVVMGFAETATGLSAAVADELNTRRDAHSTRYLLPGDAVAGGFEEAHSHASEHVILADAMPAGAVAALVVIDDELTSGRTALNLVRVLLEHHPTRLVIFGALHDARSAQNRAAWEQAVLEFDASVRLVALHEVDDDEVRGSVDRWTVRSARPATLHSAAAPVIAPSRLRAECLSGRSAAGSDFSSRLGLRAGVVDLGRRLLDEEVLASLGPDDQIVVLGTEEFLRAPQLLAEYLEESVRARVLSSSTTRSPGLVLDEPGYGLRSGFAVRMDVAGERDSLRFAYNLEDRSVGMRVVVLCHDDTVAPGDHAGSLIGALSELFDRVIVVHCVVAGPRHTPEPLTGPHFSSYRCEDVSWLLSDLSQYALERPRAEREGSIQAGAMHYSESLPVEYEPTAAYLSAYERALDRGARRVAEAVATLAGEIEVRHGSKPTLVSLARAGVPIGILLRRWFAEVRGDDIPHFALSVIRDRGIDTLALDHVLDRFPAETVVFVDGWTGKGVIAGTVRDAVAAHPTRAGTRLRASLAVLSDPLGVADLRATRDDMLIPSACLNSTVSGLVSRTVLSSELIGPGMYHGAKFYRHLAEVDRSEEFIGAVQAHFPRVAPAAVDNSAADADAADAAIVALLHRHGVRHRDLLKPGIGETTRVLLRREPQAIVLRSGEGADVAHLRVLAEDRGVPVLVDDAMPFGALGIIADRRTS
ncbi:phosphoribosyltransferase domain-containing protein [Microbacteriaceae bacterium VKM Ac-2855]|nr:phosphoribosyltransferase domain-containing protein [Microbacteriaceae bacterium VKM Ac-2855]